MPRELVPLTLEYYLVDCYAKIYGEYIPMVKKYFNDPAKRLEELAKLEPKVLHLFEVLDALDLEAMSKPQPIVIETSKETPSEEDQRDPGQKEETKKPMPVLQHVIWKDGKNPTGKELYTGTIPISDKLKDAVNYARDPEKREGFLLFLKDPMVYIDNTPEEQEFIRLAIARKNFLFADVIEGGECIAIHMAIMETCILNKEDPYCFLRFLLEWFVPQLTRVVETNEDGKKEVRYYLRDRSILQHTFPWSAVYQAWKAKNIGRLYGFGEFNQAPEPPISPYREAKRNAS